MGKDEFVISIPMPFTGESIVDGILVNWMVKPGDKVEKGQHVAELVAERLTGSPPETVIELAELGPALLGWGDPAVEAAKQAVAGADLVIFASPTYKATYTGLLKLFLDQFGAGELRSAWFMSTQGAPVATSWELLYDPSGRQPKQDTDQGTATPVPGEDGWWFVCCAD